MIVLKFGGSSLKPIDSFIQCARITTTTLTETSGLVVVSALGGITNLLQSLLEQALDSQFDKPRIETLYHTHLNRLDELKKTFPNYNFIECEQNVNRSLNNAYQWLKGVSLVNDAHGRTQARILSVGEYLSAHLFTHTVKAIAEEQKLTQYPVQFVDSKDFIKVEGRPLQSEYDEEASNQAIEQLNQLKPSWMIAPGFIGSDRNGELHLLGRNGSDLSAAIFAAGLKADQLQIWTDVEGVYTVDPNWIPQAAVIKQLSYNEAMELSFFGAKVLHPKTIAPIAAHKIPTFIKNTFEPEKIGTKIVEENGEDDRSVTGITVLNDLAMLNISGINLKGTPGLASRVFNCLSREKISIVLISQSSSEYSIAFCIQQDDVEAATHILNQEFALDIKHQHINPIEIKEELSSITVVGDRMKQTHGVAAKLFNALATANVNIIAIAQDSSERSISAIIRKSKAKLALSKTYEYFFECPRVISVILYGIGVIGSELIKQVQQQQEVLLKQRIDLRVVGIANSKSLLWNTEGLSLDNWQTELTSSEDDAALEHLFSLTDSERPINPVFVDCTSSDRLASNYLSIFDHGLHIVAANKKANTGSTEYYQQLQAKAHADLRQFGYETNVGAGLPIIQYIRNQVRSGDQLQEFSGVLSGSLSYILGCLEDGESFSDAVKKAKEKGFTEPDPREDLSGMDIARKLLIIAREFGWQAELSDISIDPLLTDDLMEQPDIETFMAKLPEIDASYKEKVINAKHNNQTLRYAGTIDKQGNMEVKLISVDMTHPLSAIRDGENAFSFYTTRYNPVPIVIRGYGAGAEVTAAGVFGDILQTIVA